MKTLGTLLGLTLALAAPALADDSTLELEISNSTGSAEVSLLSEGNGTWGFDTPQTIQVGAGTLTINSLTVDSDPSVTFSFSATNPAGAADNSVTEWQMTFPTTPTTLNLAPGPYQVSASAGVTLTDGTTDGGTDGVTLSPVHGAIIQPTIGGADAGVDLITSAQTAPAEAFSSVVGPFSASSDFTLDSLAPTIGVTLDFDLSGNDAAGISGRFDVDPEAVPEPSGVTLGLVAAAGFVGLGLRRRFLRA